MASTTPTQSRPHTPLRPPSRSSLRRSTTDTHSSPLDVLEPQFAELSDSFATLSANLEQLQFMNESLSRFNENFASFLYGLEMNAFVVDWAEGPVKEGILRWQEKRRRTEGQRAKGNETAITVTGTVDVDSTAVSDTTFASIAKTPRRRTLGQDIGTSSTRGRGGGTVKSSIPARSGSSAGGNVRGRGMARGSGLPTRGRARGKS